MKFNLIFKQICFSRSKKFLFLRNPELLTSPLAHFFVEFFFCGNVKKFLISLKFQKINILVNTVQSDNSVTKEELRHAIYACGKHIRFQSQLGQTKVSNQGKNPTHCILNINIPIQKLKTHAKKS